MTLSLLLPLGLELPLLRAAGLSDLRHHLLYQVVHGEACYEGLVANLIIAHEALLIKYS